MVASFTRDGGEKKQSQNAKNTADKIAKGI
jgi:hypothetical protein